MLLAVDNSGNVCVAGFTTGSFSQVGYVTIKYSVDGMPLWTNQANIGSPARIAKSLAIDSKGNVCVTGSCTAGGIYNYMTIKYSSAGVGLWTNLFNGKGSGDNLAVSLGLDKTDNIFVTGYATGIGSSYDYATIKLSNAGQLLWTNFFNGYANNYDIPSALVIDSLGNVYVTGNSTGSGLNPKTYYATIKYSNTGTPLWTNLFNETANIQSQPKSVAVDEVGNVFVTGFALNNGSAEDFYDD